MLHEVLPCPHLIGNSSFIKRETRNTVRDDCLPTGSSHRATTCTELYTPVHLCTHHSLSLGRLVVTKNSNRYSGVAKGDDGKLVVSPIPSVWHSPGYHLGSEIRSGFRNWFSRLVFRWVWERLWTSLCCVPFFPPLGLLQVPGGQHRYVLRPPGVEEVCGHAGGCPYGGSHRSTTPLRLHPLTHLSSVSSGSLWMSRPRWTSRFAAQGLAHRRLSTDSSGTSASKQNRSGRESQRGREGHSFWVNSRYHHTIPSI